MVGIDDYNKYGVDRCLLGAVNTCSSGAPQGEMGAEDAARYTQSFFDTSYRYRRS
jgi:hypothetical protein